METLAQILRSLTGTELQECERAIKAFSTVENAKLKMQQGWRSPEYREKYHDESVLIKKK